MGKSISHSWHLVMTVRGGAVTTPLIPLLEEQLILRCMGVEDSLRPVETLLVSSVDLLDPTERPNGVRLSSFHQIP